MELLSSITVLRHKREASLNLEVGRGVHGADCGDQGALPGVGKKGLKGTAYASTKATEAD